MTSTTPAAPVAASAVVVRATPGTSRPSRLPSGKLYALMMEGLKHGFLGLMILFSFFPFVFMIYTSFKSQGAIVQKFWSPPTRAAEWAAAENYSKAWVTVAPYVKNSLIVTTATVIGVLIVSTLASYAFARFRFPGSQFFFFMIIALLMVPGVLTLIASFMWVRALFWNESWNLIDSYWVLILPGIAGSQVGAIFLCRGFFAALPNEMFEAAKIDGANDLQIIWHIVLPLSKPILGTVAILNILGTWNDFMWPLLTVGDKHLYTVAIGLRYFQGQFSTDYGPLFAGYTIASIPLIVLFLLTMRHFLAGLTSGAIKA
jgi:ABC-type glycerol-3-phosphate transport system permease component